MTKKEDVKNVESCFSFFDLTSVISSILTGNTRTFIDFQSTSVIIRPKNMTRTDISGTALILDNQKEFYITKMIVIMSVLNILIGSRPNHNTFLEPNNREMKNSVYYRSPGRGLIVMVF